MKKSKPEENEDESSKSSDPSISNSEDLYFNKKKKKFRARFGKFKPKLRFDLTEKFEDEPTDTFEDTIHKKEDDKGPKFIGELRKSLGLTDELKDYQTLRKLGHRYFKIRKYNRKNYARRRIPVVCPSSFTKKGIIKQIRDAYRISNQVEGIIALKNFVIDPDYDHEDEDIQIIVEYMNCSNVERILKITEKFTEKAVAQCMFQVLTSLKALHEEGIIYRDIKPKRIFVNDLGKCKIPMPLYSIKRPNFNHCYIPSPIYMSPLRMRGEAHTNSSDIWSIGVVCLEMALGEYPFNFNDYNFFDCLIRIERMLKEKDFLRDKKFSSEFVDFINRTVAYDPEKRWSAQQLLNHPFIVSNKDSKPSFRSFIHRRYIDVMKEKVRKKGGGGGGVSKRSEEMRKMRREKRMKKEDAKERMYFVKDELLNENEKDADDEKTTKISFSNGNKVVEVKSVFLCFK